APDSAPSSLPKGLQEGGYVAKYADSDGQLKVRMWADGESWIHVSAPGYEEREVALSGEDAQRGERIIELEENGAFAELEVVFLGLDHPLPTQTMGFLALQDQEFRYDQIGPERPQGERLSFGRVLLNPRFSAVSLFFPQSVPMDQLPYAIVRNVELDLADLKAGERRQVELQVVVGGRIELHLVGRNPEHPPEFELQRAGGQPFRPTYLVPDERGHDQARSLTVDGPILLETAQEPGTYILRQTHPAYASGERELRVEAGRTLQVSFQLEARNF
ncbi:MAG: hypothetical protein AAGG01_01475, partial [Planctomycetota bacterium]